MNKSSLLIMHRLSSDKKVEVVEIVEEEDFKEAKVFNSPIAWLNNHSFTQISEFQDQSNVNLGKNSTNTNLKIQNGSNQPPPNVKYVVLKSFCH